MCLSHVGVFVLALMLMAAAVAATLFTWYRSAISSGGFVKFVFFFLQIFHLFSQHARLDSGRNRVVYVTFADDPPTETYCESFDRLGCENGGYPVYTGQGFACKCADDYYGERCAHGTSVYKPIYAAGPLNSGQNR